MKIKYQNKISEIEILYNINTLQQQLGNLSQINLQNNLY